MKQPRVFQVIAAFWVQARGSTINSMIDLGMTTEDDMVLAFLQAEIDSMRFGPRYRAILANLGLDRQSIIDQPDRNSPGARSNRRELLTQFRGYGNKSFLFTGFPSDVAWHRFALDQTDIQKLKYLNEPEWVQLSGGTRFVTDGAENIGLNGPAEQLAVNIRAIVEDLSKGKEYPPLIGVYDQDRENILLLEGHSRATAYAATRLPNRFECVVGSSATITTWAYY